MQFHLNGYRAGDPSNLPKIHVHDPETLPDRVDVLIVGCGPAGLTLAAQLAAFPEISLCIVDQKEGPLQVGQADGIACRTVEMFEAFGFANKVLQESYWVNETAFWKPDPRAPDQIIRSQRIEDTEEGLSEFPHVILNQARVHDFYLDVMAKSASGLTPHYGRALTELDVDHTQAHSVSATFNTGETIKARFVVGCDGARSQVRRSIGRVLHGDSANKAWGVMDVLATTDFPDIRLKSVIQSADQGSILVIPREGGYLVRLYIELDKLGPNERAAGRNITIEQLIVAAERILHPYSLDVKQVAWWSVYDIGQRLCDRFDNRSDESAPNVFIAGDACHTHSPKAGQGMNVSMGDAFNLGWKLAAVLRGGSDARLLETYSDERQAVAQDLIDFDREFSRVFSAAPEVGAADKTSLQTAFIEHGRYTAGMGVHYRASMIVGAIQAQELARGFVVGTRFHSAPVVRLGDAKPMELGHVIKADGRWRVFAFAGADSHGIEELCTFLADDQRSPVVRFTRHGADVDSVIDLRAIFQSPHRSINVGALPALLKPSKGVLGLVDYEKAFCPDFSQRNIFDLRGVDRTKGAIVVVRPDQYVAHVLGLADHVRLARFFDGVFCTQDV